MRRGFGFRGFGFWRSGKVSVGSGTPGGGGGGAIAWILANGAWDDTAPWDDTQLWKDA